MQDDEPIVVYAMPYIIELGKILADHKPRVIHNYVIWRLIMSLIPHMVEKYQRSRHDLQRILLGVISERRRWVMCVDWTNKKFPLAVGALFIRENFEPGSKESALEMIHSIREAFNELLTENVWMDDETRAVAREKANAMTERIGYPDILTNVTALENEYANVR